MVLVIAAGAFAVGVVVSYFVGALMLKPIHNLEAKILQSGRGPNETEAGWGMLNIRAELVMVRAGVTVLNGLVAAVLAVQLS